MKIGFASNDWSRSMFDPLGRPVMGGSGHIRIGQYISYFNQMGVSSAVGTLCFDSRKNLFGINNWSGSPIFDCDIIVMQRYMHKDVIRDMRKAQASGQIILNDVDDWYWGLSEKNAAYAAVQPDLSPNENIDWYRNVIKQSDGIIASTLFLYDKLSEWNPNCALHQNFVDQSKYPNGRMHTNSPDNKVLVGWMGSTSHRSGDLEILKPYSERISKFAKWHHTGDIVAPNVPRFYKEIGVSAGIVSTSPFVAPYLLHTGLNFDVGVVPLTDIPFNHAKSYIKGLEYASAGIPFVASWSPQYELLCEEFEIGLMAKSPKDYVKLLKTLHDVDYRQSLSEQIKQRVKAFDAGLGAPLLYNTILSLAKAVTP